jgi:enoyl-CoA hydratase/carnithine racemase
MQLFFHRLGPALARYLLLTGRNVPAAEVAHLGIFNMCVPADHLVTETENLAAAVARMPADGIAIAKEAYRMVEQANGMALSEVTSSFFHSFGTNLRFEDDEFNFVKTRSKHGVTDALHLRDTYFDNGQVDVH